MISIEDFAKVEIKVGKILSAEKIPDTDKLLKFSVDFGMKEVVETEAVADAGAAPVPPIVTKVPDVRQIVSGISLYYPDPLVLVGKKCMFVTNLEPRKIKGFDSNGMLFALSTPDGKFSILEPNSDIPEGTKAK